jgi:hypothetical protein
MKLKRNNTLLINSIVNIFCFFYLGIKSQKPETDNPDLMVGMAFFMFILGMYGLIIWNKRR